MEHLIHGRAREQLSVCVQVPFSPWYASRLMTAGHKPRSNEARGKVVVVPEIREAVERRSASRRVALVASLPKCKDDRLPRESTRSREEP